jgi:hypothetical protein
MSGASLCCSVFHRCADDRASAHEEIDLQRDPTPEVQPEAAAWEFASHCEFRTSVFLLSTCPSRPNFVLLGDQC